MARKNKNQLTQISKEHAEELRASITAHNESFTQLLNLVPAKYYLTQEETDVTPATDGKLNKKEKRKLAQAAAEEKAQLTIAKRLAKKAKYDPTTPRTVTEIQQAREDKKKVNKKDEAIFLKGFDFEDNTAAKLARPNGVTKSEAAQQDDDDESDSDNDIDFVGSDDDGESAPAVNAAAASSTSATASNGRPSITELRAKLQQDRKATDSINGDAEGGDKDSVMDGGEVGSTAAAGKEALLAERKRQAALREKRRKETKSRIRKEKEDGTSSGFTKARQTQAELAAGSALPLANAKPSKMSDIKKQLKKEGKRQFFTFDTDGDAAVAAKAIPAAAVAAESSNAAVVPRASTSSSSAAPAVTSNSIAFSSLDFASSSALKDVDAPKLSKKQREALGKNSKLGVTSHNPSVALSALNEREKFLSKLDPAARERAEEKDKWERMAMRAEGTKVYDDEAKLKKMLKKKEKSKDKSRKDWADRKETIQKTQASQAKKREENINSRLQAKKDKKMGVKASKSVGKSNPKKKGRPGFEGKGAGKRK